jgi:hypothetical protein
MQDDEGSKIVGGLASLFDNHRAELLRFLRARTGSGIVTLTWLAIFERSR